MTSVREAIEDVGGLVTLSEMARVLGVAKSAAFKMTRRPSFPEAIAVSETVKVWPLGEVLEWRAQRASGGSQV